jgi:hypothetical protein
LAGLYVWLGQRLDADPAFVTRLSAAGDMLLYSTYLGGSGTTYDPYPFCPPGSQYCDLGYWELPGPGDAGAGIAVDAQGQAYVTGSTYSSDFPLATRFPPVMACAATVTLSWRS